jgi:hypothetical protein
VHSLARFPDRLSFVAIVMVAMLSASVLFAVASLSSPSIALGASVYGASCDDVALRTRPSTASRRQAVINSGKQVSVVSTITGGSWKVTCAGKTTSGNTWYRINAVMGQKVSERYGVTYLYVATALVSPVNPASRYSACQSVGLRTRPSSSASRKAVISMGTKVTVVAKVTGGSYRRTCAGRSVSGRTWYKISMVGSRTAKSLYGVSYVYGPVGVFTSTKPSSTTPPPTSNPTPTPTPNPNGLAVPSSIDSTGASDASAALNAWIATVPDGSTIVFKAGGKYRLDHGIKLTNRHHLTLEGNGATLKANGSATKHTDTPIALWGGDTYITVRGFTIVGNNSTGLYNASAGENLMGVTVFGAKHVEIANNTIRNTWGDCVYVTQSVAPDVWSSDVSIHDNRCENIGRMGIALIAVNRVTMERNTFDNVSLDVLDIEPDLASQGATDVVFRNNTAGSYGHSPLYRSHFFSSCGAPNAVVRNVTVTGNTITEGRVVHANNSAGGVTARSEVARRQNFVFSDNRSTVAGPGYMLVFSYIDGLTVTGNVQPLTSGKLAYITNSTSVTYP